MDIKLESTYKGTRILFGELAKKKRDILTSMSNILIENGYQEIMIPIIQKQETFSNKVGNENQNMMYSFKDRGDRDICLLQNILQLFNKCLLRYLNKTRMLKCFISVNVSVEKSHRWEDTDNSHNWELKFSRGLDYYKNGIGFEIACPSLGSQKQVCGGGSYDGGIGFAIGIDRIILL